MLAVKTKNRHTAHYYIPIQHHPYRRNPKAIQTALKKHSRTSDHTLRRGVFLAPSALYEHHHHDEPFSIQYSSGAFDIEASLGIGKEEEHTVL